MDAIRIILYIIAAVIVIGIVICVVLFLGLLLYGFWPIGIGVAGLIYSIKLWKSGHDNIAVILCILSIGGTFFLLAWWSTWQERIDKGIDKGMETGYSGSSAGTEKRRIYDADGNVTGYIEK